MSRRQVCRDRDLAHPKGFAVPQFPHMLDWSNPGQYAVLWIRPSHAAFLHHRCAPLTGIHLGAADALQFGNSACVIEMHMRIQNELHIFNAKPQRPYIRYYQLRRLRQTSIDQDVPGFGRDQDRTQPVRAYVVGIAADAKRRLRPVPFRAILASRGSALRNAYQSPCERQQRSPRPASNAQD